jgi:hypothetical protein
VGREIQALAPTRVPHVRRVAQTAVPDGPLGEFQARRAAARLLTVTRTIARALSLRIRRNVNSGVPASTSAACKTAAHRVGLNPGNGSPATSIPR